MRETAPPDPWFTQILGMTPYEIERLRRAGAPFAHEQQGPAPKPRPAKAPIETVGTEIPNDQSQESAQT